MYPKMEPTTAPAAKYASNLFDDITIMLLLLTGNRLGVKNVHFF